MLLNISEVEITEPRDTVKDVEKKIFQYDFRSRLSPASDFSKIYLCRYLKFINQNLFVFILVVQLFSLGETFFHYPEAAQIHISYKIQQLFH